MKRKNLIFLCFLTLALLFTTPSALAGTTVVGTMNPNIDVIAVQEAVDGGGTVVLQGSFHFGRDEDDERYTGPGPFGFYGSVGTFNSVEIIGEGATIYYGLGPLWVVTRGTPGVDVIIRGSGDRDRLKFRNSRYAAIVVREGESVTTKHVDIRDVEAHQWSDTSMPERYGINATNRWDTYPYNPNLLGKLSIIGCTIDLGVQKPEEYGSGMFIFGLGAPEKKVKISIMNNIVSNCSAYGIDIASIAGTVSVLGNTVKPGRIVFEPEDWASANGIAVGQNPWDEFNFMGVHETYQPDWAHVIVRNNDIVCGTNRDAKGNFNYTMGINIWNLNGVEVKKNKIKNEEEDDVGVGALISIDTAMNVFVKKNVLSGTCQYCLEAWNPSENIHVVNNDLREVIPVEPLEPRPWDGSVSLNFGRNTKKCFAVNNKIGEPGIYGGIRSIGEKNLIANNMFDGNYLGWTDDIGCVLLGFPSTRNKVVGVKLVGAPEVDMCEQVLDFGTNNRVVGCKE